MFQIAGALASGDAQSRPRRIIKRASGRATSGIRPIGAPSAQPVRRPQIYY
jgi:hypothetical protein